MKRLSIPILVLSLFLAQSAAAQSSEEGPFYSRQHLVDYWTTNSTSSSWAINVFLNQYQVFIHSGFGPALSKKYFQCADGLIRKNCNSIAGPFLTYNAAVSYVDSFYGGHANLWLYLDSGLMYGPPLSPEAGAISFKTCYGGRYSGVTLTYVVLQSGWVLGTQLNGIACLPQP